MTNEIGNLRNVAIIAHVDHGKTTLVDQLLRQSGTLVDRGDAQERVMDSNDLERERGITILSKNTAINWAGENGDEDWRINIVDTPGHADFGGEVERVLSMVDSVLLLVDAVEGPMPQTRFVTMKALERGLCPIVVVNKIDRDGSRPDWAVDQTFDLFDRLGANEDQLDFPIVYASAIQGWSATELENRGTDMNPLFQAIIDNVSPPDVDPDGPFQMQVSSLSYSSYVGVIGVGRIQRGKVQRNSKVTVISADGSSRNGRMLQIMGFHGLEKIEWEEAEAGQIIAFTGIDGLSISDTICDPEVPEIMDPLVVDEPTISMNFLVNNSPFAGREGKFVTSRKLAILIETMRREGYELGISRPEVIMKEEDGQVMEPWEMLTVDVEEDHQGGVMEKLGERKGELKDMVPDQQGRVRMDYLIPTRGLIGFRSEFMTATSGTGLIYHSFDHYGPRATGVVAGRNNGVLVSMVPGKALAYSLFNLQERGRLFLGHAAEVYEGMLVGINSRDNDLVVNPIKGKQLTNIRAAGTDENLILSPPIPVTLEYALEFIEDDELVEVTPESIRMRKKHLTENDRKKASRGA